MPRPALASQTLAELGERIFGTDWGAPMARLTGINARTLLRVKAAAVEGVEYPAAKGALAELTVALEKAGRISRAEAERLGVTLRE